MYMTCDDKQCLPPTEVPFSVNFANGNASIGLVLDNTAIADANAGSSYFQITQPGAPLGSCVADLTIEKGKSFWSIFVLGFLGGLLALLTPLRIPNDPAYGELFLPKEVKTARKGSSMQRYTAFLFSWFMWYLVFLFT